MYFETELCDTPYLRATVLWLMPLSQSRTICAIRSGPMTTASFRLTLISRTGPHSGAVRVVLRVRWSAPVDYGSTWSGPSASPPNKDDPPGVVFVWMNNRCVLNYSYG